MLKIRLMFLAPMIAIVFGGYSFTFAQLQTGIRNDTDLAAVQLEHIQIKTQSIGQLFSELALSSNIPIGLEIAPKLDERGSYVIEFKKGTLSELLTEFVIQHREYAWELRDGVVNVFPKNQYRDVLFRDLLETRIEKFVVKENTSCWAVAESLIATPEVKKKLEANDASYRAPDFTGFYIPQIGRHFTLDVSNLPLRSILNRLVKQSPTARFWIIARNNDGSLNMSFAATHEDSPNDKRTVPLYKDEELLQRQFIRFNPFDGLDRRANRGILPVRLFC